LKQPSFYKDKAPVQSAQCACSLY